jgi:PhnB protein
MKGITPYLNFDGDCREAMTFYQRCLGGELRVVTFADAPMESPPESRDRVLNAHLASGPVVVMASDTMPGAEFVEGNNVCLSVECADVGQVESLYEALAEGGEATMRPHDAFWGDRFGMLTDRFGIRWMLNCPLPARA